MPHTELVGRVAAVFRYPVKSMAAESLSRADVSWHGVAGDRRWAFVRPGLPHVGFPWLTLRQNNSLGSYRPAWADPSRPDRSAVLVRTPTGAEYEVVSPDLAKELGEGVRVMKLDRGAFDSMPLSLITTTSVAEIARLTGEPGNALRFRPNLLVEPVSEEPFLEDVWVGSAVGLGSVGMRVDRRDKRCVIVNIDPATGLRSPATLKVIARQRDTCLGVYGSVTHPGTVTVGDPVVIHR